MMEIWKTKAKKQAQWINRYPTQILNQSKRVWKWAIEEGKGSAWIYYIFAICQWLPNNHRVHYSESVSSDLQKCKLCLMNVVEDTNHIFSCPALLSEQMNLHAQMEAKLRSWKVLLAEKQIESLEHRTCRIWFKTASTASLRLVMILNTKKPYHPKDCGLSSGNIGRTICYQAKNDSW